MRRLTERDEFRNADIIGVDSADLQCNLAYDEFNRVTDALNKLAEYEDLEEQGKLIRLPCKLGDTVYYLTGVPTVGGGRQRFSKVLESMAKGFYIDDTGIDVRLNYDWQGNHGTYGRFGETIFLTQEAAEAALKEMEE